MWSVEGVCGNLVGLPVVDRNFVLGAVGVSS